MKTSAIRLATAAAAVALALTACSSGLGGSDAASGSGSGSGSESKSLTLLIDNGPQTIAAAKAVTDAFEKANPGVTVKIETRPGGTEGDNLIKTRLSTGEMTDVFFYNSGSLLQALNPDKTLVDLTDDPAMNGRRPTTFMPVVSHGRQGRTARRAARPSAAGSSTTSTSTRSSG